MFLRLRKAIGTFRMGIALKLRAAIGVIVGILLITTVISILEFRRMSTYVSDQISDNITCINLSAELGVKADEYNLKLLSSVGYADSLKRLDFNPDTYLQGTDAVLEAMKGRHSVKIDSLDIFYADYVKTSKQLDSIIVSDFVDTREWYFTVLQPKYNTFRKNLDQYNVKIYTNLQDNSVSFDESFYRSIMPSIISVVAAIALCLLLQFFILTYYVKPLKRMLYGLDAYNHNSQAYNIKFEGNDELVELNSKITDMTDEASNLRKRIRDRES